jgi:hypothetical protein
VYTYIAQEKGKDSRRLSYATKADKKRAGRVKEYFSFGYKETEAI